MSAGKLGPIDRHERAPHRGRRLLALVALLVAALVTAVVALYTLRNDLPLVGVITSVWRIGTFQFRLESSKIIFEQPPSERNPVIAAELLPVKDGHFAADPFLARQGARYYIFFELFRSSGGDIAVSSSTDGFNWRYEGIVLDEPFHLSYPHVFADGGSFYMVPESGQDRSIRLYRSEDFPRGWRLVGVLLKGQRYEDPTVFYHDGTWWMFASIAGTNLHLYYASDLQGPWIEHPQSPVVHNDIERARPAGGVIDSGGELIRLAQSGVPSYGSSIRAFRITRLNREEYREIELPGSPILSATGRGWTADGIHQLSILQSGTGVGLAAIDGRKNLGRPYLFIGPLRMPLGSAPIELIGRLKRSLSRLR